MLSAAARRFAALPTTAKLLLILSAVLLPIGAGLVWVANQGIQDASRVLRSQTEEQARLAAQSIESLLARNALALRIAATRALLDRSADPCADVDSLLATAPGISRRISLRKPDGELICASGGLDPRHQVPLVAPGGIRVWIDSSGTGVDVRTGVTGGMATASVSLEQLRGAALQNGGGLASLVIRDGERTLAVISPEEEPGQNLPRSITQWPIANGQLVVRIGTPLPMITTGDRLILLLPFLMWLVAALLTWVLVTRLLIRPLRRLQQAVVRYQPGAAALGLPRRLGPATEIEELRDAFARAVTRVEESEREMTGALEGQRRLVREVHHRVKNNLQVVASLINIHGRSAESPHARAAYGSISRRVGALSIVHRNHFAEMEENRGIALRPLVAELAAELRATAPDTARGLRIDLDLEGANTTQDVAVSIAFLVTEIVEFAMLRTPEDPVEITLRRTSELTARLTLSSKVLNPDEEGDREKVQFERIVAGLAKQLRSTLDRKLGRYSVELPVFPPREL
jgi:two-component system, sensor histidine kinase PdtaS